MKLWYPNFLFDLELDAPTNVFSGALQRSLNMMAPVIGLLGNPGDTVLVQDDAMPQDCPSLLESIRFCTISQCRDEGIDTASDFHPWGWSQPARTVLKLLDPAIRKKAPSLLSVLRANSRTFQSDLDYHCPLDTALDPDWDPVRTGFPGKPFGRICRNRVELQEGFDHLRRSGDELWGLKSEYSQSARNRLLGRSGTLNDHQESWIARRFRRDQSIKLEPWVQPLREYSVHFDIARTEAASAADDASECTHRSEEHLRFAGWTELLNDETGQFRGSIVRPREENSPLQKCLFKAARLIGRQLIRTGYFGPVGIDSMIYRDSEGTEQLRFCHDINARYSMGRVACQIRDSLNTPLPVLWNCRRTTDRPTEEIPFAPPNYEIVSTRQSLPGVIGDAPSDYVGTVNLLQPKLQPETF